MNYSVDYHNRSENKRCTGMHFHNNLIEIIQIVSGRGTMVSGHDKIPFEPGDLFFVDGRVLHGLFPDNKDDFVRNRLSVDRRVILELAKKDLAEKNACKKCETERFDYIDDIYRRICENINNPSMRFAVLSDVFEILHMCIDMMTDISVGSGIAWGVKEYIHSNLNKNITIDDIAESVHMSKFYICRRFKEETGMTVKGYLKQVKANNARQYLAYSDKSVAEIAEECGFPDVATFTKTFKQVMGYTPTACRKKLGTMGNNKK